MVLSSREAVVGEPSAGEWIPKTLQSDPKKTQTAITEMEAAENSKGVNIMSITEWERTPDFDRYLRDINKYMEIVS